MNSQLSPERRRVMAMAAAIAAISAAIAPLSHRHPKVTAGLLVMVFAGLVCVVVQFMKLNKSEGR